MIKQHFEVEAVGNVSGPDTVHIMSLDPNAFGVTGNPSRFASDVKITLDVNTMLAIADRLGTASPKAALLAAELRVEVISNQGAVESVDIVHGNGL